MAPDDDDETEDSDSDEDFDESGDLADEDDFKDSKTESEIRSFTDEAFRENESRLFEFGEDYLYANVPKMEVEKVIYDYKPLWKRYKEDDYSNLSVQTDV